MVRLSDLADCIDNYEPQKKLYIAMYTIHGLVRGDHIELGRDADTGGQVKYVVELVRELGKHPRVARCDLFTRLIDDDNVSESYAREEEPLGGRAYIVRLPFGPSKYIRKELLWPYLDAMVDKSLKYFQDHERYPDIIHGHYADAGYVATQISLVLGIPCAFTGHSLGIVKKARLVDGGMSLHEIESNYRISKRINAEQLALSSARFIVASTTQEIHEQYEEYDDYRPAKMKLIPPGTDLSKFYPLPHKQTLEDFHKDDCYKQISRFLSNMNKPIVFCMARASGTKNITGLVRAYGENRHLQKIANLVILAGTRSDIPKMSKEQSQVLQSILLAIDKYDLYGKVAYPKHHKAHDVPNYFRMAAVSGGVFVNPALVEPFGLTIIEASASGAPVIATNNGGPVDILRNCRNGALVDPQDSKAMGETIYKAIRDQNKLKLWSKCGLNGVKEHYTWGGHAMKYIEQVDSALKSMDNSPIHTKFEAREIPESIKLEKADRILLIDLGALVACPNRYLSSLRKYMESGRGYWGVFTCWWQVSDVIYQLREAQIDIRPHIIISACGSGVHYRFSHEEYKKDHTWKEHIDFSWYPEKVQEAIIDDPRIGLSQMSAERCEKFVRFTRKSSNHFTKDDIYKTLRRSHIEAEVCTCTHLLTVLPVRASVIKALRYLCYKFDIPIGRCLFVTPTVPSELHDADFGDVNVIIVPDERTVELSDKINEDPRLFLASHLGDGFEHFQFFDDSDH